MSKAAERYRRAKALFGEAVALPVEQREAFLRGVCGDDAAMLAEVRSLLVEDATGGEPLQHGSNAHLPQQATPVAPPGYRLLREIGRGGMGVVWLAERSDDGFKQRVALKWLVADALRADDRLARFRAERRILASLDHPHIARLIDGGSVEGMPFLAMEYVEGERLDRWVEQQQPTLPTRIALFTRICRAVQAAHRQLVVHRDLKPANILVDRRGEPKLLDFGIAKLLDDTDSNLRTGTGMQLLTPRYAAPEQVRGEWVGTATDVYALGVILYELLTGHSPYPEMLLQSPALLQAVCETPPTAPSGALAGERRSTTQARGQRIDRDLDAIVLKCLRKEPEARYASAAELADDLERLLRGEAVLAMTGHRGYQLRKFLARHRAATLAAAAVLATLLVATVLLSLQLARTERERQRAEAATTRAREALLRVQRERDRAKAVTDFLGELFREADPLRNQGRDISMREALTRGASRLEASTTMDAQTRAALFGTLAHTEMNLGAIDRSLQLAERALADLGRLDTVEHEVQVQVLMTHAAALREKGRYDESDAQFARAWSLLEDQAGLTAADILSRRGRLASDRGDPKAATALFHQGAELLVKLAKAPDFGAAMRDAEPGPLGELIAVAAYNLCSDGQSDGDYVRALALCQSALAMIRRLHGEQDSRAANILNVIGNLHSDRGDHAAAAEAHAASLAIVEQVFGAEHTSVAISALNLGVDHFAVGDFAAALAAYQRARHIFTQALGPEHRYTLIADNNVADMKMYRGDLHGALADHERILAARRRAVGDDSPEIARSLTNIARVKGKLGQTSDAVQLQRNALALHARVQGDQHPETLMLRLHLAQRLFESGETRESSALAEAVEQFFLARREQDAVIAAARFTRARALASDPEQHRQARRLASLAADYARAHPGSEWIRSDEVDAWLQQQADAQSQPGR